MKKITIILVEWDGYRLNRTKKLGENTIKCGLGRLLKKINHVDPGIDFDLHLIINNRDDLQNIKWYQKAPFFNKNIRTPKKKYLSLQKKYPFITKIHFRSNIGMDIGAYNSGLKFLRTQKYKGDVIFMNSSLRGPSKDNWLFNYHHLFNLFERTGLCGTTLNSHNTNLSPPIFMPHAQSFFLYTNMSVLSDVFNNGLPGSTVTLNKEELIYKGEIGISTKILDAGYSICASAFPDYNYKNGDVWTIPEGDIRFKKEYLKYANQV